MNARAFTGFVLGVSLALSLISAGVFQGSESRPANTGADPSTRPAVTQESTKVCMVTSVGGMDDASYDGSFNITAWKGVEDAMAELGIQGLYVESPEQADYTRIIRALLDADCDLLITVGWTMAEATKQAANANPNQKFAVVDFAYAPGEILNNILELTFNTREAAFLAGYLSAGMTRRGTVSTFGAIPIPPVTEAMDGYVWGVRYYNLVHNTDVQVVGWDPKHQEGLFTGNFESLDDGRAFAAALFDEGADIVFPVAGAAGLGAAAAAQERGLMAIGLDIDWYVFATGYQDTLLTSVLKKMDVAVFEAVQSVVEGSFEGGTYVGRLVNNGVVVVRYGRPERVW